MEVAAWLRSFGLERYAEAFQENEIDVSLLPRLTADDLKDMGVVLIGHRRKLLDAIARLEPEVHRDARSNVNTPNGRILPRGGERRQLTVMFVDLVESTELSTRLDPEDLSGIIRAYQATVGDKITRFGGHVAKLMGDCVLAYFGWPIAHEDDAERAVQVALAIVKSVSKIVTGNEAMKCRIGIATGMVVVGELVGEGAAQEEAVVGETPNLAARLQGIAEPDSIILADSTKQLLNGLFELSDLGRVDLKGITEPVQAWAALRPRTVESRFDARHATSLTELVGRDEELELLVRRWSKAKLGSGQVVLIAGEAGIGKSRLTAGLLERLAGERLSRRRYFCSPQHTESALYPIIGQLERAAKLAHDDAADIKLDKLDALLAESAISADVAFLFAELLSLPNTGRYTPVTLTPEMRRQRILDALTSQLESLAGRQPVLMILEDAHWIDPTSLEMFRRVVDRRMQWPLLLIVTFRPEFRAPWIGQSDVTSLTLNRLGASEATAIVERLIGNKAFPADVMEEIVERTDGIPLFVEEMTKAVLEMRNEDALRRTVAAVPLPALAVPASLHASLMARLDRLGSAKEIMQVGAAIGREFSYALLSAVTGIPPERLLSALDRLVDAGLLFQSGVPPQANYLFKHALVQDAAYGTLLREPRRLLHARIAQTLQEQFGAGESQPEIVARHYASAGLVEKAIHFGGKAGEKALHQSALAEAVAHLSRALEQIVDLPSTQDLRREQIALQVALITPLLHVKGYIAPETRKAMERARSLIEQAEERGEPPEDPLLLFSVLYAFWTANVVAFDPEANLSLAKEALALAEKQNARAPLILGHRILGTSLTFTGAVKEGKTHFDRAIPLYNAAEQRDLATRFGVDSLVALLGNRSLALWLLGYPDAALSDCQTALENAREVGQAATIIHCLTHIGFTQLLCGDLVTVELQAGEIISLSEKVGSVFWNAAGRMNHGSALSLDGRLKEGIVDLTTGIDVWRNMGATLWIPFRLPYLAIAHAQLGNFDAAWDCIKDALAIVEATRECWFEAEIHRTAGSISLLMPEPDTQAALKHFEVGLVRARQHEARSLELRVALSMARLYRHLGLSEQARDLLVPIYTWFVEGFETQDLKSAKAFLAS